MRRANITYLVSLTCALMTTYTHITAKPIPTNQPINITADHVFFDQAHHTVTYSGHVIADRNKGHMTGHKLVVYMNARTNKVQRLVDFGSPAFYQDVDPRTHAIVSSHANIITMIQKTHQVYLDQNAYINKQGSILRAPHISYNQIAGTAHTHVDHVRTQHTDITILPTSPPTHSVHSTQAIVASPLSSS